MYISDIRVTYNFGIPLKIEQKSLQNFYIQRYIRPMILMILMLMMLKLIMMALKLMGRYSRDQLLFRRAEEFQSWQGGDTSSGDKSDGFDGDENDDEK